MDSKTASQQKMEIEIDAIRCRSVGVLLAHRLWDQGKQQERDRRELALIRMAVRREKDRLELMGVSGWQPPPRVQERMRSLASRIYGTAIMRRADVLDVEDLWRNPRLLALGPPRSIPLEDTPESRAAAGYVKRDFSEPTACQLASQGVIAVGRMVSPRQRTSAERRGRRGGRKHRQRRLLRLQPKGETHV